MWPPAKNTLPKLGQTHTCTSPVTQKTLPELLPEIAEQQFSFICRQGGGTKLLYWHVFSQEITEKMLSGNVLACLCHCLSLCIQYNIIRSFLSLHIFSKVIMQYFFCQKHLSCTAVYLWGMTCCNLAIKYLWKPETTSSNWTWFTHTRHRQTYIYAHVCVCNLLHPTCRTLFGSIVQMA